MLSWNQSFSNRSVCKRSELPNKFLEVILYKWSLCWTEEKKLTDIFISPTSTFSDNENWFFFFGKNRLRCMKNLKTIIFSTLYFFSDNASKCPGPKIAGIVTKSAKVGPKKLSLPPWWQRQDMSALTWSRTKILMRMMKALYLTNLHLPQIMKNCTIQKNASMQHPGIIDLRRKLWYVFVYLLNMFM